MFSKDWRGEHLLHERFCLGLDSTGRPLGLPPECPACKQLLAGGKEPTVITWRNHWKKCQPDHPVTNTFTMKNIIAMFEKDLLPTTDWNASFGNILTRRATLMSDRKLWPLAQKWESNPNAAVKETKTVLREYRADFSAFFGGAIPLSFHAHISDINPHIIVSAILALELESACIKKTDKLSAKQIKDCGVVVFKGSYGAGRGVLAGTAAAPFIRETASGQPPTVLALAQLRSLPRLKQTLSKLRSEGTVAVIVEIVSSSTGRLLTKDEWENLAQACHSAGLYLVVDEAQTAVRCGAPFAHHLSPYSAYRPSFVLFGKGLRACGIAAYTEGVTTTLLGHTSETMRQVTYRLDSTFSEPINSYVLLQSWAIVRAAMAENWPQRAARIGDNLRRILADMTPPDKATSVMGMGAFILVERSQAAALCITGASAGKKTIRWLPPLDKSLANYEAVRALFGPTSAMFRDDLYQLLDEPANSCVNCGEALEGAEGTTWVRCPTCKGAFCGFCTEEGYEMAPVHQRGECLSF
ncbi:PLP-dependent transferase [Colletotrichum eremochloae]|nr:PLP-dependent transferase [Colletotrichum eremochloae]